MTEKKECVFQFRLTITTGVHTATIAPALLLTAAQANLVSEIN